MKNFILSLVLLSSLKLSGQLYEGNRSQHRFAQTYIGLNTLINPSSGKLFLSDQSQSFPTMVTPRFTIGGLHFWGRWDFKLNFPLAQIGDFSLNENTDLTFLTGGEFGARYYPWRIKYNKLRPFVGFMINEMSLGIKDEVHGDREDFFMSTNLVAGLSYMSNDWQLNAEWNWMPQQSRTFYSPDLQSRTYELPANYFSFGIVKYFDGTLREEERKLNGETKKLEKKMRAQGKLNSFSIAIAPSGAYFLKTPSMDGADRRSLPKHKYKFNWDVGAGYLFHDAGMHVSFSYRGYTSTSESYGKEHIIKRGSYAVEGFKYFWDYNGFVPFVGASLSYERWAVGAFENDVQQGETAQTRMLSLGILFGWDILASPLETWVLRTNLRYYPFQEINDSDRSKARVDQFEFNFIQLVLYPSRMKNIAPWRK